MNVSNDLGAFGQHPPRGLLARIIAVTRRARPTWAGKRLAFFLRAVGMRLMRGQPMDVESLGAKMRLYPWNNICEKRILFTPQFFDEEERDLLAARITDDFVFIDIGANVGGYALFVAARAGAGAQVLAVEPQPEIFERLIYNIRQNPFANVKAIDCAISDKNGEITLFLDRDNSGETSVRIMSLEGAQASIRVPAKTLISVVQEEGYGHIDAIKLDVEGAEDLILDPFFAEAPQHLWPKLILMEHLHQRWTVDLPQLLRDKGYVEVQRTRNNTAWELRRA